VTVGPDSVNSPWAWGVYDPRTGHRRALRAPLELDGWSDTDGARLYQLFISTGVPWLEVWDLSADAAAGAIDLPPGGVTSAPGFDLSPAFGFVRVPPGGGFLWVGVYGLAGKVGVYLYNVPAGRWVGPPVILSGELGDWPEVSAAAGVIVMRAWRPPAAGLTGGYDPNREYLAVWDVPEWRP